VLGNSEFKKVVGRTEEVISEYREVSNEYEKLKEYVYKTIFKIVSSAMKTDSL
jgi:hypothetical protein